VLNDTEVKKIVEAITEYRELIQQSSEMRDQLESLQKRWFLCGRSESSSAGASTPSTRRWPS